MQSINFTLFAPSGSGGAFISEILDDNHSQAGDRNFDNYRSVITNEYAGSKNLYMYLDYDSHFILNEFPEWNENTILYGKEHSPLKFFKNCVKSPKMYYVDVTGYETLMKELVFLKKFVGNVFLAGGMGPHLRRISDKTLEGDKNTTLLNDNTTLKLLDHRLERISQEYDGILHIHSPVMCQVMLESNMDPTKITKHEVQKQLIGTYKMLMRGFKNPWTNIEDVADYTEVLVIKYDDLVNGRDTGTKLDDHKNEMKSYFERNEEILERFLSLMNI